MTAWQTLGTLAKLLDVSRRTLDRALDDGAPVTLPNGDDIEVESRPAGPNDYDAGIPKQTKTVARVVPTKTPDPQAAARAVLSGQGSAEETLQWLERIRKGEEQRVHYTSRGERVESDFSDMAQLRAASDAQKIREYIAERDREYIPREDVASAMVELASMLSHRLAAVPSRVAGEVDPAFREALVVSIDEIRTELGDESERLLKEIL